MSLGKRNPHTEDRDPHTGHMTTGHDWDGIKELNTPVPKVFFLFLAATVIASVIIWLLVPAWPTGVSYTKGLLGVDQRSTVTLRLAESEAARASWAGAIEGSDFAQIQSDDTLMSIVRFSGSSLFSDNCAACHGQKGDGGPGFPDLTSETWLWGGDADSVWETIRVGINSAHPESRSSEMLAFGRDQMLDRDSILDVVAYIQSLSQDDAQEAALDGEAVARGSEVFAMNCVA